MDCQIHVDTRVHRDSRCQFADCIQFPLNISDIPFFIIFSTGVLQYHSLILASPNIKKTKPAQKKDLKTGLRNDFHYASSSLSLFTKLVER